MGLPKRLYIVRTKAVQSEPYENLKQAIAEAEIEEGEKFSYRIYEGGNSVECESLGGAKFRERRK